MIWIQLLENQINIKNSNKKEKKRGKIKDWKLDQCEVLLVGFRINPDFLSRYLARPGIPFSDFFLFSDCIPISQMSCNPSTLEYLDSGVLFGPILPQPQPLVRFLYYSQKVQHCTRYGGETQTPAAGFPSEASSLSWEGGNFRGCYAWDRDSAGDTKRGIPFSCHEWREDSERRPATHVMVTSFELCPAFSFFLFSFLFPLFFSPRRCLQRNFLGFQVFFERQLWKLEIFCL